VIQDLLRFTDEMDLDILNRSMEVMVEEYQEELMPVAAELAGRLVGTTRSFFASLISSCASVVWRDADNFFCV
jgi:hypothetical protein